MTFATAGALLGMVTGLGLFLVWRACWQEPERARRPGRLTLRARDMMNQAGLPHLPFSRVLAASAALTVVVFIATTAITASWAVAGCFALFAAVGPVMLIRHRARSRQREVRAQWPEAIDNLSSGIRAGLSLPEAVMQLAERGPEELREHFQYFTWDYRTTGSFVGAMQTLKLHCADPIADRIAEALILTRHVGGSDAGVMLRTLADFVRAENRVRAELTARQQWTVAGARLAVAAPWIVLGLLSLRPENAAAYSTPSGVAMLLCGLLLSGLAYTAMRWIGRLPAEPRVLR